MSYSIDAVARLTGISPFTLRNWESRYHLVKPKRMRNGFRAYSDEHVELLKRVLVLMKQGARIGDLAKAIRQGQPLPDLPLTRVDPALEQGIERLFDALRGFDFQGAEGIYEEVSAGLDCTRLLDEVLYPLLTRVEERWNEGKLTFAQKRFSSKFLRLRLAHYLTEGPVNHPADPGKKVVFATLPGESHEDLHLYLAVNLRFRGWTPIYLGTDFPIQELGAAIETIQPRLACLAFTDWQGIRAALGALSRFGCEVCVGGAAALTFDPTELPANVRLFQNTGQGATDALLECLTPDGKPNRPRSS